MKKIVLLLAVFFVNATFNLLRAQDVCAANPKYCKVLNDTSGIKMMLITLPPGAKLATHTHPVNMGYDLKGGLYKWTYEAGGKTESVTLHPGDHFQGAPEAAHHSWNAGTTTIEFILIEKD